MAAASEGRLGGTVESAPDSGVRPCLPSDFWQVAAPSGHRFASYGERPGRARWFSGAAVGSGERGSRPVPCFPLGSWAPGDSDWRLVCC